MITSVMIDSLRGFAGPGAVAIIDLSMALAYAHHWAVALKVAGNRKALAMWSATESSRERNKLSTVAYCLEISCALKDPSTDPVTTISAAKATPHTIPRGSVIEYL